MFSYWRTTVPEWQEDNRRIEALWQSHPRGTTQLVLQERDSSRAQTHLLERGNFLEPAEEVSPGVPDFLHPLVKQATESRNRRGSTSPAGSSIARSPTTARSIVNRIWQAYFGTGLVATTEDLGTQGEPPSHPELLDWLAVEFMDHNWSLKHIHRLIVTSATYRQSSAVTPELAGPRPGQSTARPRRRASASMPRSSATSRSRPAAC